MSLNEIPEPEFLKPPEVCMDDFLKALSKIKPTVSIGDLQKQEEFTKEFGQEG
jgi:vacuolar protein-sorting-associated protein 4